MGYLCTLSSFANTHCQLACTYYQCVFIETVQTHIVNVVNVPEYIVKVHILTMIHNELRTTATTGHKKKYHMIIHFYITRVNANEIGRAFTLVEE